MYAKDFPLFLGLLSPKKEDRILDVGAGLGTIANSLTEFSEEVFALEPNDEKLEYTKAKHSAVKAFSATAAQIPFPTSYFDKLYALVSFHHFPDQGDALEEFRRVTKKDGLILIQELDPNDDGKFLAFFEKKIVRNKTTFLSPSQLDELVSSRGFKTIEIKKGNRGYFLIAQNVKSSDEEKGWIDTDSPKFT